MIRWFKDIKTEDFNLVGGKGYNLAVMYQANIKIPNGFVVTTEAYEAYLIENDLVTIIEGLLLSPLPLASKSQAIMKLFVVEKVSPSLRSAIREALHGLDSVGVAVRSSATVEDLPDLSFAGQYSTYLNVTEKDLIQKVVACWQSLWQMRAMEYRRNNHITTKFSHGVVIQAMVNAKVSGVMFTANPMNGLRNQLVINASYGLGEAIVSGEVNPDQIIVDKSSGAIINEQIQTKDKAYRGAELGIEKVDVQEGLKELPALSQPMIGKLLEKALEVEAYFKKPQDIEFSVSEEGEVLILQSRGITTLYPIEGLEQDGKLRAYMSASTVLLGMKEPFTHLGYDLMSLMFPTIINVMTNRSKRPIGKDFVRHVGGRIFVDMTYLLSNKWVAKQFGKSFSGNDLPLEGVMNDLIESYGQKFKHQGIHFKLPLGFATYGLGLVSAVRKVSKIPHEQRYQAMIEEGNRWYEAVASKYKEAITIKERLEYAETVLVEAFKLSQLEATYCMDVNNYIKIEKVLKKYFGQQYNVATLAQSLPGCFTQTMNLQLNVYAKECVEGNKQPLETDVTFKEILSTYGHRGTTELDFGTRRWSEDPSYLLGLVKTYMKDHMYERNLANHASKKAEAEKMIEEITKVLMHKIGQKRARKFRTYMIHYRYGAAMREYPKSDIVRFMALGRKAVLSIGDELVASGHLTDREDVFYLYKEQLLEGKCLARHIEINKAMYKMEMKRTSIPRMLLNNGHTYYSAFKADPKSKTIQGMALSPGTYEGIVRVVFDPETTELKEGEIMVTESTNPAWTPLFATAGALIMSYGGPMSHGGIVAREYGIPAVVGIPSATSALKDGQRVRINGENGIVEILD